MVDWLAPVCSLILAHASGPVAAVCAALLALLAASIALGFGPLRAWIGWPVHSRQAEARDGWDGGLFGAWRLWRAGRGDGRAAGEVARVVGSG